MLIPSVLDVGNVQKLWCTLYCYVKSPKEHGLPPMLGGGGGGEWMLMRILNLLSGLISAWAWVTWSLWLGYVGFFGPFGISKFQSLCLDDVDSDLLQLRGIVCQNGLNHPMSASRLIWMLQ